MTKIDWSRFPVIPGFDAIECKRRIQAEIYEETKDMTRDQVREYYRQVVERGNRRRAALAESADPDN